MAQFLVRLLLALPAFRAVEDSIVNSLLRQPGFHRFVGRIQRGVDELQNGPHPSSPPLRPGEATEDPARTSFVKHFADEIRNQLRGTPSEMPPPPPPPGPFRPR